MTNNTKLELPVHAATTQGGQDWLTMALDPFHDFDVPIAGLPDRTNIATATQFVKKKITISAPPNLTAGQTWDCHIFTLPFLSTFNTMATNGAVDYQDTYAHWTASPTVPMGTVNIACCESGQGRTYVGDDFATWDDTSNVFAAVSPTDGNKDSSLRLIAGGFEVHNDTAELYKSGSVTVYSSPNNFSDPQMSNCWDAVGGTAPSLTMAARYPPNTSTEASLNTDARTWSAKDGCYIPFRLDLESNATSFRPRSMVIPVLHAQETGTTAAKTSMMVGLGAPLGVGVPVSSYGAGFGSNGWAKAPIETTGAFFSGLSQETVLTLDIRFLTEIAPTAANPALMSMTSPSAKYDPRALECYTNCVLLLPPGVPVSMNAKGDWWRPIIKAARAGLAVATPFINATGPVGATLGTIANAALAVGASLANTSRTSTTANTNPTSKKKTPSPVSGKTVTSRGANNTFRK